jgi:hypothetical protein
MPRRSGPVPAPRTESAPRTRADALVSLVSRLLLAQAGVSAVISICFSRRHAPWLLVVVATVTVCCLAGLVRSGSHAAWLMTVCFESAFVAVGLFRFAYARYMGGTLLAMITLGTLLHPAVSRAFVERQRARCQGAEEQRMAPSLRF